MPGRLRFLDFSQNNSCWLRIDFSPVRMFAAAVFPILNISASFLHPKFGLPLAKSKTSPFHQAIKSFCSVYQQADALKVTYLWQLYFKISICQCLHIKFRQREYYKLTFDFAFDCKNLKFMVCFYETQTNMSISEILLRNIDEKINIIVEKDHQFSFNSFV